MKKTFVLISLLFVLVACIQQTPELPEKKITIIETPEEPIVVEEDSCSTITDSVTLFNCYVARAINESNYLICEKVESSSQIRCYQNVALALQKPEPCVKIPIDRQRDECYDAVARTTDNFVLCGSLVFPDLRKECYASVKMLKNESRRCSELWTSELKQECYGYFD